MPTLLFKLRPCCQKLCNVYYLYTPSLGWIRQIKGHSLSPASARSVSWLAYSLHPRSLTPIWSWIKGCTKPMATHAHHAHPWIIISRPCPPMNNNIAPMPTQNPWIWVGMGMDTGTQCRTLLHTWDREHVIIPCWWKRWSRSKFDSLHAWGANGGSTWMQDGCKVYVDFYMASNVSWSLGLFSKTASWR
jgi:hypothetical protein